MEVEASLRVDSLCESSLDKGNKIQNSLKSNTLCGKSYNFEKQGEFTLEEPLKADSVNVQEMMLQKNLKEICRENQTENEISSAVSRSSLSKPDSIKQDDSPNLSSTSASSSKSLDLKSEDSNEKLVIMKSGKYNETFNTNSCPTSESKQVLISKDDGNCHHQVLEESSTPVSSSLEFSGGLRLYDGNSPENTSEEITARFEEKPISISKSSQEENSSTLIHDMNKTGDETHNADVIGEATVTKTEKVGNCNTTVTSADSGNHENTGLDSSDFQATGGTELEAHANESSITNSQTQGTSTRLAEICESNNVQGAASPMLQRTPLETSDSECFDQIQKGTPDSAILQPEPCVHETSESIREDKKTNADDRDPSVLLQLMTINDAKVTSGRDSRNPDTEILRLQSKSEQEAADLSKVDTLKSDGSKLDLPTSLIAQKGDLQPETIYREDSVENTQHNTISQAGQTVGVSPKSQVSGGEPAQSSTSANPKLPARATIRKRNRVSVTVQERMQQDPILAKHFEQLEAPVAEPVQEVTKCPELQVEPHGQQQHMPRSTRRLQCTTDSVGLKYVNQYIVIKLLGRGTFGKVKLCLNTMDCKLYAVKIIHRKWVARRSFGGTKDDVGKGAAMHEIAVMKKLHHPNIVALFEVIDDPSNRKLYLVLEYVEGGPIMDNTWQPIPEEKARQYFRDMCRGLDYLHFNKILHRDLKPGNLLQTMDGRVKISDFGVSHMFDHESDSVQGSAGTPAFLAPEMCFGGEYLGRAADIWALGVCLYVMVFGEIPFSGETLTDMYLCIICKELAFPSSIKSSKALKDLLSLILTKDPRVRISLPGIMHHEWVSNNGSEPLAPFKLQSSRISTNSVVSEADVKAAVNRAGLGALSRLDPVERHFEPGEYIMRQGEEGQEMYLINSGECEVLVESRSLAHPSRGRMEYAIAERGPGQYIGEMALSSDSSRPPPKRTASIRARTHVVTLVVSRAQVMDTLSKNVEAAKSIANTIAERDREMRRRMKALELRLPSLQLRSDEQPPRSLDSALAGASGAVRAIVVDEPLGKKTRLDATHYQRQSKLNGATQQQQQTGGTAEQQFCAATDDSNVAALVGDAKGGADGDDNSSSRTRRSRKRTRSSCSSQRTSVVSNSTNDDSNLRDEQEQDHAPSELSVKSGKEAASCRCCRCKADGHYMALRSSKADGHYMALL